MLSTWTLRRIILCTSTRTLISSFHEAIASILLFLVDCRVRVSERKNLISMRKFWPRARLQLCKKKNGGKMAGSLAFLTVKCCRRKKIHACPSDILARATFSRTLLQSTVHSTITTGIITCADYLSPRVGLGMYRKWCRTFFHSEEQEHSSVYFFYF